MTKRTIPVDAVGPIALDLTMHTGTIHLAVDPVLKQARVELTTDADAGPSADAIRDTDVSLAGQNLTVRVSDTAGGAAGSTTVSVNGSTVTFSGGRGVRIDGGNIHVSGHGGGKVFINGREVTPDGPAGPALTPITLTAYLPAESVALVSTHSAKTVVTGELARLDFDATSGNLTAERIGELDATVTSGKVLVSDVTGSLTANVTSGYFAVGAYSGHDARLTLTSGQARMAATSKASGRMSVGVTSGQAYITGAAHLNVRRRATSGYVQVS
ncbi:DUF4097 family beta strand repeat-containing protein [Streptomyces alboflavus]|uniref:DUF4097 family beta strand repeat-containing protein n=1 Tax=Streptomyces alboflavus TaxID=67267 RepID=UPI0036CB0465